MSIGEFMGPAPSRDTNALPTAPKERGADDDGAFKRRSRRDDESNPDYEPSRSEADSSWRRGGGAGGGFDDRRTGGGFGGTDRRSGGFDDRGGGGGYNDRGSAGGYNDRGGAGGYNDRGGFGGRSDERSGFGSRSDDRSGFGGSRSDDRGGSRFGGRPDDRGGDRFAARPDNRGGFAAGVESAPPAGERPRLNLMKRSAPITQASKPAVAPKPKVDPFGAATPADTAAKLNALELKEKADKQKNIDETDLKTAEPKIPMPVEAATDAELTSVEPTGDADEHGKARDKNQKRREPVVVNSRAAAFESAPTVKRENNNLREPRPDRAPRGPPPVVNKRFEALADDERDKIIDHRRDLGPPEPTNSRFAAAADADRSHRDEDRRGPPVVQNSRFAAAAEADRSYRDDDRGPPPTQNSRFAAVADADRDERPPPRGPPPTQNSRFAAAAAESERDNIQRDRRRDNSFGRENNGPPPVQNSRFAAAVAADEDYVPEDRRRGPVQDREGGRPDDRRGGFDDRRGGSDDRRGGYDDRRGGYDNRRGGYDDRRGGYDDPKDGGDHHGDRLDSAATNQERSRVADLLKPKARTLDENVLKVPEPKAPVHTDNMLKVPTKTKAEKEEEARKAEAIEAAAKKTAEAEAKAAQAVADAAVQAETLAEFISGKRLGAELKQWSQAQGKSLPSVEQLVYGVLIEKEQKNPDPECTWADPSNYGSALVSIVGDDIYNQMQVLWGIQKYCDKLGFPKLNDQYLVQSMFRAAYKFDLAAEDAFAEWKEDESDEHIDGKIKAVIQTVDWFAWLEQDGEEDEEEYYEDDEE